MDEVSVINGSDVMASSAVITTNIDDGNTVTLTTEHQDDSHEPQYHSIVYIDEKGMPTDSESILLSQPDTSAHLSLDQSDPEAVTLQLDQEFSLVPRTDDTGQLMHDGILQDSDDDKMVNLATVLNDPSAGLQPIMMRTGSGELVQVIPIQTIGGVGEMKGGNQLIQVLPIGAIPSMLLQESGDDDIKEQLVDFNSTLQITDSLTGISGMLMPNSLVASNKVPIQNKTVMVFQAGTPLWASRIQECEKIGNSYRGWVDTEVELDLLLTYHKQQTNSFWGTRQSPSPAKPSTRLMWKSQYVHFDGIPFVNAGSRAIVYECQFGPRRKGALAKRQRLGENYKGAFRQTCPARIYVKKVRKFPDFAVDVHLEKKLMKSAMDKAFMVLRESGIESGGEERYYVQLPTQESHEFHGNQSNVDGPHRIDPRLTEKIREYVSRGETRLYVIRRSLRVFVEKDLFSGSDRQPEKHDLTLYPTVNDLQNHIHQAVHDIETGLLAITAPHMTVEMITGDLGSMYTDTVLEADYTHTESITVTLTQNANQDGQHVISKVETHLSDGTTEVSTNLTPETAKLLSKLHPGLFQQDANNTKEISYHLDVGDDSALTTSQLHQVHVTMENPDDQHYVIADINGEQIQVDLDSEVDIMLDENLVQELKKEPDLNISIKTCDEDGSFVKLEAGGEMITEYAPVHILDPNADPTSHIQHLEHLPDTVVMDTNIVLNAVGTVAMDTTDDMEELQELHVDSEHLVDTNMTEGEHLAICERLADHEHITNCEQLVNGEHLTNGQHLSPTTGDHFSEHLVHSEHITSGDHLDVDNGILDER